MPDESDTKRRVQRLVNISSFGGVVLIVVALVGAVFWSRWEMPARIVALSIAAIAVIAMLAPMVMLNRIRAADRKGQRGTPR